MCRSISSIYYLRKFEECLNKFSQTKYCQIMQCFFMYIGVYLVTLLSSNYLSSIVESQGVTLAIGVLIWMVAFCLSLRAKYRTPLIKLSSVLSVFGFSFANIYMGVGFMVAFAVTLTYQDYRHVYAPLYEGCVS